MSDEKAEAISPHLSKIQFPREFIYGNDKVISACDNKMDKLASTYDFKYCSNILMRTILVRGNFDISRI